MIKLKEFLKDILGWIFYGLQIFSVFLIWKYFYQNFDNYDVVMDMVKVFLMLFIIVLLFRKDR